MTATYYEIGRDDIPAITLDDGRLSVSQVQNFLMLLWQPHGESSTAMDLDVEQARQLISALTEGIRRIEAHA